MLKKLVVFGFDSDACATYEATRRNIEKLRESFKTSEVPQVSAIPGRVNKKRLKSSRF